MNVLLVLASVALIMLMLIDGFEAMILPRRIMHRYRLTRLFYRSTWSVWRQIGARFSLPKHREAFLSIFGPLSLLCLFSMWILGLIVGFGLLHWSLGTELDAPPASLSTYLYLSGTTFFTLGYGDVTPHDAVGRALAVCESGVGFGFMAVIIGYLPVLYQAFSTREQLINLLDSRAGSPPTAGELVKRMAKAGDLRAANAFLHEAERWAAGLLESHLSFPVLSYYRSQHDNQSWLAALATILDTASLALVGIKGVDKYQAQLTFAMARHAAVDLSLIFWNPPKPLSEDRLPCEKLTELLSGLTETQRVPRDATAVEKKLTELRGLYEPILNGLAQHFLFTLPPMFPEKQCVDNWQTSAWMKRSPGFASLPISGDEHFY